MSQPAVSALSSLPFELVYEDGEPLETYWHRLQMNLLIDVIEQAMAERGRQDVFVGGNMFVYYSYEQARDVAVGRPYFRGPDVFYVGGVEPRTDGERKVWVSWEEGGRLPDVIIELLSPSTAVIDRTIKKDLYSHVFRTPEYFLYDRYTGRLEGFRLRGDDYQPLKLNSHGRLWSQELGLELGFWQGVQGVQMEETTWVRLFHPDGRMVPTSAERAEAERLRADAERQRADAEHRRAEAEHQRADAAEAELARLRARLGE
jgi:Uma2 family endonuclease